MVFNDVTDDYSTFISLVDAHSMEPSYIKSALTLICQYQDRINKLADTFLKSSQSNQTTYTLTAGLNSLEANFSGHIATMNTSMRNTTRLISKIEGIEFQSPSVKCLADNFCQSLNKLMDITEEYASNKIKNQSNTDTFFRLISELQTFLRIHTQIYSNNTLLKNIENELLETIPLDDSESAKLYYLDIRSYKQELNIASFTDDLKLLADCLQNLERLACPSENHTIFIRKIESGSLKALFGSNEIDFSIFPDLITSISNAIKTWRLTPAEKDKMQAETDKLKAETELIQAQAQAQYIQNEGSKMAIVRAQIDYLCDKLSLDSQKPENIEQIQNFCLPLVTYIEHNPVGSFNGINYDISKEVRLLESSNNQEQPQ